MVDCRMCLLQSSSALAGPGLGCRITARRPDRVGLLVDPQLDRGVLLSTWPYLTRRRDCCGRPVHEVVLLNCRIYWPPGPTVFASSSTQSLIVASFSSADEAMTLRSGWHATPTTTSQWPSPGESGPGRPSSTCTSCVVQRVRSGVGGCHIL